MPSNSQPTTPGERVCAVLDKMEMTAYHLAREAHLGSVTITAALAVDGKPSLKTQCAIEAALGQPFWSTPEEFQRRKEIAARIGFAPETASLKQLRRRASQLQIKKYGSATDKAKLTAVILAALDARKKREEELRAWMAEQI